MQPKSQSKPELLELRVEVFRLRMAILRTIKENRHLSDGEKCTLHRLVKAVSKKTNT